MSVFVLLYYESKLSEHLALAPPPTLLWRERGFALHSFLQMQKTVVLKVVVLVKTRLQKMEKHEIKKNAAAALLQSLQMQKSIVLKIVVFVCLYTHTHTYIHILS